MKKPTEILGMQLYYHEDGLPYDEKGIRKYNFIEPDSVRGQAFLEGFKSQFPELTGGPERLDKNIMYAGKQLCAEIESQQRKTGHIMSFEEMKKFIAPRVKGGRVDRSATPEEADQLVRLTLATLGIEYTKLLPA